MFDVTNLFIFNYQVRFGCIYVASKQKIKKNKNKNKNYCFVLQFTYTIERKTWKEKSEKNTSVCMGPLTH